MFAVAVGCCADDVDTDRSSTHASGLRTRRCPCLFGYMLTIGFDRRRGWPSAHPQRGPLQLAKRIYRVELRSDSAVLRRKARQAVHEAGHDDVHADARLQLRARAEQHLQRPQVELVRKALCCSLSYGLAETSEAQRLAEFCQADQSAIASLQHAEICLLVSYRLTMDARLGSLCWGPPVPHPMRALGQFCCSDFVNHSRSTRREHEHEVTADLDDGLHEVLLRNVVLAADDLLHHPRQHHVAVQVEIEPVQLQRGKPAQSTDDTKCPNTMCIWAGFQPHRLSPEFAEMSQPWRVPYQSR